MQLSDLITKSAIIKNIEAQEKTAVLEELVGTAKKAYRLTNFKVTEAVEALLKREKIGSTGIGNGIAVPHAKVNGLSNVLGVFGRSAAGIDFNSLDGAPAHLLFLVLAPPDRPEANLKALQRIAQAIKQPNFCKFLREAKETKGIMELFREVDAELDKNYAPRAQHQD